MYDTKLQQARFSDDYKYIIDSNGKKLNYDDPRVVHVWAWWGVPYFSDMIKNIFEKRGWRCRTVGKVTHKTIEDARKSVPGGSVWVSLPTREPFITISSRTGTMMKSLSTIS